VHLNGIRVLVTRPAHQAEHLCTLIEADGGQAVRLPVIDIVPVADKTPLLTCRQQLSQFHWAIFTSVNAVEHALPDLLAPGALPQSLRIAAVGQRTAQQIANWGLTACCPPPPFNSEVLLALPELQAVAGHKIALFRGQGGHDVLKTTLSQRGAHVEIIEVYRRVQPPAPAWQLPTIDVITLTSVEALHNLFKLLSHYAWLTYTPLAVMSQRIGEQARVTTPQAPVFVAPEATDEGLLTAIRQAIVQIPPLP